MIDMYIVFLDKNNVEHRVPISIYESRLGNKWAELIKVNAKKELHSSLSNYTLKDLGRIHSELNKVVGNINKEHSRHLPVFDNPLVLDTNILNSLHEEFEIYGTQVEELAKLPEFSQELHNNFLLLNELIHTCEDVLAHDALPIPVMGVISDYYPQEEFANIEEIDKLYLKSDFRWGEIFLGYNTLGKDWLKVCHDNDIEVIEREMVKPQTRFSAETWINLGPDDYSNYNSRQFENWYNNLPASLQANVPVNNLNELCLGRFQIGHFEIKNPYFLEYHNNWNDWMSPNHPIKKKWNEEVFSTFRKIVKIGSYTK